MTIWSSRLREDLCARARSYAEQSRVEFYQSRGAAAVTLFPTLADGTGHGNFSAASFAAIQANPAWRSRLAKPHTRRRTALPAPHDSTAKEMDSCTSSDALAMNVFCYPSVVSADIAQLMGVPPGTTPAFGMPGLVPLLNDRTDATEVDMVLGDTSVEAKLTESTFTARPKAHVERYARLYETFEKDLLPTHGDDYQSYQLIRNVLAVASRRSARFVVLLDARRPDLLREWWVIHTAIRDGSLRARCAFVTWQELAAAAPLPLRSFLELKYGL